MRKAHRILYLHRRCLLLSWVPPFHPGWPCCQFIGLENRRMKHTISIASPSAVAFFFSLALTFAVANRTAVATFVTASFFNGFVDAGYANKLGFTFETYSNLGACRHNQNTLEPHTILHKNHPKTHLQIPIQPDNPRRLKRQTRTMLQRIPISELTEHRHTHDSARIPTPSATL